MKNLLACIVLITLCSCGKSSGNGSENQSAQGQLQVEKEESLFVQPKINFYRSLTIDESISPVFEDMTINPEKKKSVLGDEAFYVMSRGNVYPSYNEYNIEFYSKTKLESISVFDTKSTSRLLSEIKKEHLPEINKRELTNLSMDIKWGERNLDNSDYDMMNKAYIVKTSTMDRDGGVEYKAETTYLMWFECKVAIRNISDIAYACGKFNLKFHYKILDYALTSNAI